MVKLGVSSKLNADWSFLDDLRDAGRSPGRRLARPRTTTTSARPQPSISTPLTCDPLPRSPSPHPAATCPSITEGHFLLIRRESNEPIGPRYRNNADTAFQFDSAVDETAFRQAEQGRLQDHKPLMELIMINTKLLVGSALAAMASLAASATIAQAGPAAQPEYLLREVLRRLEGRHQ